MVLCSVHVVVQLESQVTCSFASLLDLQFADVTHLGPKETREEEANVLVLDQKTAISQNMAPSFEFENGRREHMFLQCCSADDEPKKKRRRIAGTVWVVHQTVASTPLHCINGAAYEL